MRPFAYARASTVAEAVEVVDKRCRPVAGGTDLIGLMKRGLIAPERLVSLTSVDGLTGVEKREGEWSIGALTTLADLASLAGDSKPGALTPLYQAAAVSASPQLRHVATIGGNLMQRPRCWYFRNPQTQCWLKGGDRCLASAGENRYHAILGAGRCRMVHPSDPAVALLALDARVEVAGRAGNRELQLDRFFDEPRPGTESETVLRSDELITAVRVAHPAPGSRGVYVKICERQAWDFALVSAAAVVELADGGVGDCRIVLGGVAAKPWRAREAEEALMEGGLEPRAVEEAVLATTAGAVSLSQNGYKVRLVEGAVGEALRRLRRASRDLEA